MPKLYTKKVVHCGDCPWYKPDVEQIWDTFGDLKADEKIRELESGRCDHRKFWFVAIKPTTKAVEPPEWCPLESC